MRNFLIFLFCTVLFSCASKSDDKVEASIKSYMKQNMNDFNSYEPVETSKPDSFYLFYNQTAAGRAEWAKVDNHDPTDLLATPDSAITPDSLDRLTEKTIKSKTFYGWKVFHKYRAKNAVGATILSQDTFYFDRNFQLVNKDTIRL